MNAVTETLAPAAAATSAARPFYWSVRRELWEHRALYLAPLVAAGVVLVGFIFSAMQLAQGVEALVNIPPERQRAATTGLYASIGALIVLTMAVTSWFYALDSLQGERRDRSVLFWKSMPVSDTTVVLSKLFTAMVVAPAIAFVVVIATQILILLLSSFVMLVGGANPGMIWSNLQLFQLTVLLLYTLVTMSLWYAPLYGWLLFVSSWAERSTFLLAVLPIVAIVVFEDLALETHRFATWLEYRLRSGLASAFDRGGFTEGGLVIGDGGTRLDLGAGMPGLQHVLDPTQFFSNPQLWIGLIVTAALVATAVWVRRYREPL